MIMKAGFAEREYTPAEGSVPGQILENYAVGRDTPLMAHVAMIESDGVGTALIQLDILFVSTDFATKIRNKVSQMTGYPFENVWVTCSHSHTSCAIDHDVWAFKGKPEYVDPIEEKIMEAVAAARENMVDVKLGVGTGYDARYNFCRDFYTTDGYIVMNPSKDMAGKLVKPYAAVDHTVNVMRIEDLEGKPRCFIVNFANHLDTNRSKAKFDADFPGWMRLALQREYGEDVAVLFLNGCCANINHIDFLNYSHKETSCRPESFPPREIGEGLAQTVLSIQNQIYTRDGEINIQGLSRSYPTVRRRASAEDIAWAKELKAKRAAGETVRDHYDLLADMYLKEEQTPPPTTVDFGIHVLQIGPWTIVGLPGEIYSDIGLKIKANSPYANTIVVEIANGYFGYVSPDIIQHSRCYEGRYSMVAYTGLGAEKVLIDGSANMLHALFDADNVKYFGTVKPDMRG